MWLPELLLIAFVPGALLFRAPVAERDRRAQLAAEERVFWAVVISAAWSSIVVLALAAASWYTFPRLLIANGLLSAAALAAWRGHLLYRGTAQRPGVTAFFPVALVALGMALFFPVAEFVIGGRDPGVYINEGIALAQRGSLVIRDSLVAAVQPVHRDLFFPPYHDRWYYSLRFMGFFLVDPLKGTVVAQFPHLYPAWVAVGYGLDGLSGGLRMIGAWAIFGLLGVYFAGARLLGRIPAFCASALLALCVVELWFGRYPNSEIGLQALLFAGLLAFARSHVDNDRFFAPVAGVVLGLLVFLRFDAVLAWAGVGLAVLFLLFRRRWPRAWFVIPMVAALVAVGVYISTIMRPGFGRYAVFFENLRPIHLTFLGIGVLAAVALLLLSRNQRLERGISTWSPPALGVVVVGAVIYAWFFRVPAGRLAPHDALSLRTFTWYFPWAGLIAAVAGFVLLAWRRFWRDPALLLVTVVYGFFVFYKIQIVPEHFWMTRRFVPVILPSAFLLLAAGAFYGVWSRKTDGTGETPTPKGGTLARVAAWVPPLVFVTIVGALLIRADQPVFRHVEYQGLWSRVEALSNHFGPRDLVVVESRRSSDLHVVALPLAYIFNRNVLVLSTPRPDRQRFRGFLDWARSRYQNVYFVGSGGTDLLSRAIAVVPVATERFQVPEYEAVWDGYPRGPRQKEFDFSIYKFVDPASETRPFDIDVGTNDDLYVVRFNAKEWMNGRSFRWTTDSSYVTILGLTDRASSLAIWMDNGGRPASAGPATITCYLDNRLIGEATVDSGFKPYSFAIPADIAAAAAAREEPALLRIASSPWSPKAVLGVDDHRTLGVMVQRVAVK